MTASRHDSDAGADAAKPHARPVTSDGARGDGARGDGVRGDGMLGGGALEGGA